MGNIGDRFFNIEINGNKLLEGFDILREAGAQFKVVIIDIEYASGRFKKPTVERFCLNLLHVLYDYSQYEMRACESDS